MTVTSANTTIEIYNDIRGKSLAPLADTIVKLRWELNKKGVPMWPPSAVEEREDMEGLPSFDAWVATPLEEKAEPSSTPLTSQPTTAPAHSSLTQPSLAQASLNHADASTPINLTND
ncbi:hypothetical protein SLEP1_g28717 [Rubroshorea leprosula]|uniref:Uncharacterized protein n=1 Tax=Rubroshorea leprosula TaxID=152421 RepID=A0AAV5JUN3_9ROSI|nr:hypothetical protein SLEP1_g28717 [Rubroshorea leprosula]